MLLFAVDLLFFLSSLSVEGGLLLLVVDFLTTGLCKLNCEPEEAIGLGRSAGFGDSTRLCDFTSGFLPGIESGVAFSAISLVELLLMLVVVDVRDWGGVFV